MQQRSIKRPLESRQSLTVSRYGSVATVRSDVQAIRGQVSLQIRFERDVVRRFDLALLEERAFSKSRIAIGDFLRQRQPPKRIAMPHRLRECETKERVAV